jgi:hypothetical protein
MQILIDGNRSTNESWLVAHRVSEQELPAITPEEETVAGKLSISTDDYRRSKYAAELTKRELESRALKIGQIVENWLRNRNISAEVESVWLKTFDGKFRIDVKVAGKIEYLHISEDLVDDIFDSGSREAQQSLDRLLAANFQFRESVAAS